MTNKFNVKNLSYEKTTDNDEKIHYVEGQVQSSLQI